MAEYASVKKVDATKSDMTGDRLVQTRMSAGRILQTAKMNPGALTSKDIFQLQKMVGNQWVAQMMAGQTAQREELPEEEEPVQGKFTTAQREELPEEEEEPVQGKFATAQREELPEEEEPVQGKFATAQREELLEEEEALQMKSENLTGMPDNLKIGVESLSGMDMSNVRVQYNSDKPASIGALAYTQGSDIHVASGQEKYLPHEAWHVVQQAQGRVQPTMQLQDVPVNDDAGLEEEADVMGQKALQMMKNDDALNEQVERLNPAEKMLGDVAQLGGAKADPNAEENGQAIGRGIEGIRGLIDTIDQNEGNVTCTVAVMVRYPEWKKYFQLKGGHAALQVQVNIGDQPPLYLQVGVSATGSIQVEGKFTTVKEVEGYSIKRLSIDADVDTCKRILRSIAKEIATDQPYQERIIVNTGSKTNCSVWAVKMAAEAGMDLATWRMNVFPSPNDLQHSLNSFRGKEGYTLTDSTTITDVRSPDTNVGMVPDPIFDEQDQIANNLTDEQITELKEWATAE